MLSTSVDFAFSSLENHAPLTSGSVAPQETANDVQSEAKQMAFNARLEAVLRGTANAYGAFAVELWLLDDLSTQLARHTAWESPNHQTRLTKSRTLATSDADVAALAGSVIVLESQTEVIQWESHRTASAAVCMPVSSDRTVHGVMWIHFDTEREVTDAELEILEIISGRLAVEIERETLLNAAASATATTEAPAQDATSETVSLDAAVSEEPLDAPAMGQTAEEEATEAAQPETKQGELELANWSLVEYESDQSDWKVLSDNRILAFSSSVIASPEITPELANSSARIANQLLYQLAADANNAGELLTQLNHRLCNSPNASAGLAYAIALLDSEGVGSIATAGPGMILDVRAAHTNSFAGNSTPLGWDVDAEYSNTNLELLIRQRLLLLTGMPQLTNPLIERELSGTFRAPTSEAHRTMTAQECIDRLLRTGCEELNAIATIRRV